MKRVLGASLSAFVAGYCAWQLYSDYELRVFMLSILLASSVLVTLIAVGMVKE
jgi:hypothetical protein